MFIIIPKQKNLESLRTNNWRLSKSVYTNGKSQTKSNIKMSTFQQYFKAINNPDSN